MQTESPESTPPPTIAWFRRDLRLRDNQALIAATSVSEAFARYAKARVARANFVLVASRENGINLTTTDPDHYNEMTHRNEESLDLASYNALTVPV